MVMGIMMFSCGGGDGGGDTPISNDYIRIDENVNNITFSSGDLQRKFTVQSNCNWTITVIAENWSTLSIDHREGSGNVEVLLSTDENKTLYNRTASLIFKSPGITKTLTITQEASGSSITVGPKILEVSALGGTYNVLLTSNDSWYVKFAPDWCKVTPDKGDANYPNGTTITIGCDPNTSLKGLSAQIILGVNNGAAEQIITVTQAQGELPVVEIPQFVEKSNTSMTVRASYMSMFDVTEYGFYYGTSEALENQTKVKVGINGGKSNDDIKYELKDLEDGTTYYVRTYAVCATGTNYSPNVELKMDVKLPNIDDNQYPGY